MDELALRCNIYNRSNGTNLTPKEYYNLILENLKVGEKVNSTAFQTTVGLERSLKNKTMRRFK